jgi:hypothetical protein
MAGPVPPVPFLTFIIVRQVELRLTMKCGAHIRRKTVSARTSGKGCGSLRNLLVGGWRDAVYRKRISCKELRDSQRPGGGDKERREALQRIRCE